MTGSNETHAVEGHLTTGHAVSAEGLAKNEREKRATHLAEEGGVIGLIREGDSERVLAEDGEVV